MSKVMIAPGRYVQGAGAIAEVGKHISLLGKKALITGGNRGISCCKEAMAKR